MRIEIIARVSSSRAVICFVLWVFFFGLFLDIGRIPPRMKHAVLQCRLRWLSPPNHCLHFKGAWYHYDHHGKVPQLRFTHQVVVLVLHVSLSYAGAYVNYTQVNDPKEGYLGITQLDMPLEPKDNP